MIHLANTSAHLSAVVGPVGLKIQACRAPDRPSVAFAAEDILGVEVPKIGRCVLAMCILTQRRSVWVWKYASVSVVMFGNRIRLPARLVGSSVVFLIPPPRCLSTFAVGAPSRASGHVTGICGNSVKESEV
jgi:hypothetical protein